MGKQNKEAKEHREDTRRYRISLVNDEDHRLLWNRSFTSSGLITATVAAAVLAVAAIYSIIAFTPVRRTIPGYPDAVTRRDAIRNAIRIDSLEREIKIWELYAGNISKILAGEEPDNIDSLLTQYRSSGSVASAAQFAQDDSLLRADILEEERFAVGNGNKEIRQIEGLIFYPPVKGIVTQGFNPSVGHPFIDIAASENSVVAAVLDGTVIGAGWDDDTGFTIHIQHANDLVSIYKHNEKLLKNVGDKVKAGTSIALVGNTGKLSSAPHLHFELWHKGEAIDPAKYINF